MEYGHQVPLRALREHLPAVPRAELADLRQRYRRVVRHRRDRFRGRLLWKYVGAVWSIDFTEPSEYIGGADRWILAIRDLTSGYQLAWLSFAQATADCVVRVLAALFTEHGPPLVLKSDNGSQFIAEVTLSLLRQWQVEALFNPPRRPAYNGGLERTHPLLKGYTRAAAAAQGRPAGPLPEDLQTALIHANRFTRRLGDEGPTADEAWRAREPISAELRRAFRRTVAAGRLAALAARGLAEGVELNHYQQAAVDREAIRDALLAHDLLEIRPRGKRAAGRERPSDLVAAPSSASSALCAAAADASAALPCALTAVICLPAAAASAPREVTAGLAPSSPPAQARVDERRDSEKSRSLPAPPRTESCRITPVPEPSLPTGVVPLGTAPTHGESAPSSIPRRLITPLLNWFRRAKIR